jgi:hypothetical protein
MDEVVFLIVLGAFAILYAAGWLVISFPRGKRRDSLSRARLKVWRAMAALGVVPLRLP